MPQSNMSIICWLTVMIQKDSILFCVGASSNEERETVVTHSSLRKNSLSGRGTLLILYAQPVCASLNLVNSLPCLNGLLKVSDWRTSGQDWWDSLPDIYFEYYDFSRRVTSVFLLKPYFSQPFQSHQAAVLKLLVLPCIGECAFKIFLGSELCLRVLESYRP